MDVAFLVNAVDELDTAMTTVMLIEAAVRRGLTVAVAGVADLELATDGHVAARAIRAPAPAAPRGLDGERTAWLSALKSGGGHTVDLGHIDHLVIRTNPARDRARWWAHHLALDAAERVAEHGVRVVNHPRGLRRAAGKHHLLRLPQDVRPPTLVSHDPVALAGFVAATDRPTVLKPVHGTRGRGVFLVRPGDPNLGAIIELLTADDYAVAQAWVPGAEAGDVRVIVQGGRPLEIGGATAAIRRVPSDGDFRSNLHAGGRAERVDVTPGMRAVAEAVGRRLANDGIMLAGIDLIGEHVIEVNVHSPGGLRDAERFYGVDFCDAIIHRCIET